MEPKWPQGFRVIHLIRQGLFALSYLTGTAEQSLAWWLESMMRHYGWRRIDRLSIRRSTRRGTPTKPWTAISAAPPRPRSSRTPTATASRRASCNAPVDSSTSVHE